MQTDISVQFFATVEEQAIFASHWMTDPALTAVGVSFRPFSARIIHATDVPNAIINESVSRVYIAHSKPDLNAQLQSDFEEKNRDALLFVIGRMSNAGLKESWIACRTTNSDAIKKWKVIEKHILASTLSGITAISRTNGVAEYYPRFRYTPGALFAQNSGVEMLPIQGISGPQLRLGIPGNEANQYRNG